MIKVAMPDTLRVRDVMTEALVLIRAGTPLETAWRELHDASVSGAPVLDDRGRLVGVISVADFADPRRTCGPSDSLTPAARCAARSQRRISCLSAMPPLSPTRTVTPRTGRAFPRASARALVIGMTRPRPLFGVSTVSLHAARSMTS
jgi:CBS-domain-containing membrane protein